MAKIILSPSLGNIRGRIGDLVFRTINGRTFASQAAARSSHPPTAAQAAARDAFRAASSYAKAVMADPIRHAVYERVALAAHKPVYAIAVGDYYKGPTIVRLDVSAYQGRTGDVITVAAIDDVHVAAVTVAIKDMTGKVIESGPANLTTAFWRYAAKTQPMAGYPLTIEATALDLAGNQAAKSVPWVPPTADRGRRSQVPT